MAGDEAAARPLLDEGLAISRASGERSSQSVILQRLAWLAIDGGDYGRARGADRGGAGAGTRELAFVPGVVRTLATLGLIARLEGDYRRRAGRLSRGADDGRQDWRTRHDGAGDHELAGLSAVAGPAATGRPPVRRDGGLAGQGDRGHDRRTVAMRRATSATWPRRARRWARRPSPPPGPRAQALTLEEAVAEALADEPAAG